MYYELIVLALVCLVSPWLAKMAGFEIGRKPFDLVAGAGIFFLAAAAFGLGMNLVDMLRDLGRVFMIVTFVIGWIVLGAGALWATFDVIREPDHALSRSRA